MDNFQFTEKLMDDYLKWYKSKTTITELKKATEIITPFTNHINDRIALYIQIHPDQSITLTDDGITLDELSMMDFNLTGKRKLILNDTLRKYNIHLEDGILSNVSKNIKEFPQKKHDLIQCILSIYDLLLLKSSTVRSLFKEEVYEFFYENNFGGNIEPKYSGDSGLIYNFDYSLGATKDRPTLFFQFIRKPDFQSIASRKFMVEDISNDRTQRMHKIKFIIISEEDKINQTAQTAADYSDIEIVPFKDKEKLKVFS